MDDEPETTADAATPAPAPPPPDPRPRGEAMQLLLWTLRFAVTVALALALLVAGFGLAIFGLAVVALVVAVILVGGAALVWRRGMLPAAVLATALALPATVAALSTVRFDRSVGTLIASPQTAAEASAQTYSRGVGSVLVDLRRFRAPDGSTTLIRATADNGRVVVALPTSRCFALRVHYGTEPIDGTIRGAARAVFDVAGVNSGGMNIWYRPTGLSEAVTTAENNALNASAPLDRPTNLNGLLAFGRLPSRVGEYRRDVRGPAPTLDLTLRATDQIVVRSFPDDVGPLNETQFGDGSQVAGMNWPQSIQAPVSPGDQRYASRSTVRTRANRAQWVAWERRVLEWGAEQARRYAGPCPSETELRERATMFLTQPERVRGADGRVHELLGGPTTRTSPIKGQPVTKPSRLLRVEVNGLGEVKVLGTNSANGPSGVIS